MKCGRNTDLYYLCKDIFDYIMAKNIIIRYLYATSGLFFVALGIALSIISNLGAAPLSCPAYVLNLKFMSISVGTFTFLCNLLYILVQLALFRKDFKARYLLQIIASAILGYFIDAGMWLCAWCATDVIAWRIVISVIACVLTAIGISMEVAADAWMLSAELTVLSICHLNKKFKFGTVKILMDTSLVLISAAAAWIFFGHILGNGQPDGVVISWGTLLLAFLPGYLIPYTDKIVPKI